MRVFFFIIGAPTPIFEIELELIRDHDKAGDTLRVLQCTGNLGNCHWNNSHGRGKCTECRSRFKNGWQLLNPGGHVELDKFPPLDEVALSEHPQNFNSVDEIKHYRYDGEVLGYGIASSLISRYRDHRFDPHVHRRAINQTLTASAHVYETLKHHFEEFRPDIVYIFNGRIANHLPAVLLCKKMGIKYYTYEVSPNLNHYLLREKTTVHDIAALHEEMENIWTRGGPDREDIAHSWFKQKRAGIESAEIISFTEHQKRDLLPERFNPGQKNIALFNSTLDEYAAIEGLENSIYSPDETAGIARILQDFEHDKGYMFYLRVHPHMKKISQSRNSQLRDIAALAARFANLHVIWPAEKIDSYALLDACAIIITFGSTLGVEAAYWGKPSILAGGPGLYRYLDCVYTPRSHAELIGLLQQDYLPALPAYSALKYGYREIGLQCGTPFKYFQQTEMYKGTFDGVVIKSDFIPWLWFKLEYNLRRIKNAFKNPWTIMARFSNKQPD